MEQKILLVISAPGFGGKPTRHAAVLKGRDRSTARSVIAAGLRKWGVGEAEARTMAGEETLDVLFETGFAWIGETWMAEFVVAEEEAGE